jgi:formate-dependent nitrite reductase cytochrome c552 subunit
MTKVLLAVDEENIILEKGIYRIFAFSPTQAKADAQKMVEEYKECIYDLVFAYSNKDEEFPHNFELKALIDAIKLSEKAKEFLDNDYLIQKYLGGK